MNAFGRLTWGLILDQIGMRYTFTLSFLVMVSPLYQFFKSTVMTVIDRDTCVLFLRKNTDV